MNLTLLAPGSRGDVLKAKAGEISRRIQSENGISRAIEAIERLKENYGYTH